MLVDTADEIVRDADIKRAAGAACEDIDPKAAHCPAMDHRVSPLRGGPVMTQPLLPGTYAISRASLASSHPSQ